MGAWAWRRKWGQRICRSASPSLPARVPVSAPRSRASFAEAGIKTVLAARSADSSKPSPLRSGGKGGAALACATDVTIEESRWIRLFEQDHGGVWPCRHSRQQCWPRGPHPDRRFDPGRVAALDRCHAHRPIPVRARGDAGDGEAEARAHYQYRQRVGAPAASPTPLDMPRRNSAFTASPSRWPSMGANTASRSRSSILA